MVRSISNTRMQLTLVTTLQNTLDDGNVVSVKHPNLSYNPQITNGLGANQANRGWQVISRTLENGSSEDIDIYDLAGIDIGAGAGNDGVGQAVVYEEIVGIAILNNNPVTSSAELEFQPSTQNGWTPIGIHTKALGGSLKGQGLAFKSQLADTAFEVDDGSSHRIKFTANGGSVDYSIYLLPRSDTEESSSSSSSSVSTSSQSTSVSTSSSSQSESSWSSSSSSSSSSISTSSSSISTSSSSSSSSTSTSSQSSSSSSSSSVSTSSSSSSSS